MSVMNRIAAAAGVCLSMFANLSAAQVQPLNASFESPAVASGTRTASPAGSNWTFAGTAGIERFAPTTDIYGGGFTGSQVAYISAAGNTATRGSVAQSINFPSVGNYVVRFAAGRIGKNNGVQVSVGSTVVESEITPNVLGTSSNPQFESWWTVPFYVGTAGIQEVKFTGTQSVKLADGDLLWIDQITVASAPVALDNSSFESATGWTLGNGASITASTKSGKVGAQLLRIPEAGGNALAAAKTFQAGTYALSLRMARTYAGTAPCGVGVYRQTASGFVQLTTVPGARTESLVPYTSASFDLPAGTYSLYFSTSCGGSSGNDWDSLVLSLAAPNFGDPDFTAPDIGYPANPDDRPLVYQPVGSPWTFTGPAGIQANPGAYWSSQPVTIRGHQYGFLDGTFARLDQSLTLTAGTYVLVAQASNGLYKVTVNGQVESSIARGYSVSNGSTSNPGLDFGEVVSAPFTVATSGSVMIGVRGAGGSTGLQGIRVLRINTANPPPTVALAMTLNGTAITAPVPAGVTVRATATASDSDGLSLVRVLRDGTPLSPTSTTSPLAVDVTLSTPGATHVFVAEATDTLGAVGTASQTVNVLANSAPVITSFSVSPLTPQVSAGALTLSATASDTDAYVSSIDYYWRNVDSASAAQYISGQSCVNSSSAPVQPFTCNNKTWTPPAGTGGNYALSARATDNNAATNTSSEIVVSVCGPKVTLNSPTTSTVGAPPGQNAAIAVSITAGQYSTNAACGAISLVEVLVNGVATTVPAPPSGTTYTTTLSRPASGTPYNIQARVTEAGVRSVLSNVAAVTVITNAPPAISAVALTAGSSLQVGQTASWRITATDDTAVQSLSVNVTRPDGTVATAAMSNCTGSLACDASFAPGNVGVHTLTITAVDNRGATTSEVRSFAVGEVLPTGDLLGLPATAAIGVTAGSFAVAESGAATYTVPLQIAAGVNGVQPSLALSYSSQGGDGPVGVGWGLSGTSTIMRCPKTLATDGIRAPINYDNITDPHTGNDAFCLDGQRLLPVTGGVTSVACQWPANSGTMSTCRAWEFRTENENYARVIAIGDNAVNGSSGSGPTRFRVYTKAGQVLEYGSRWWGVSQPRPDNTVSLITNPSFEDTDLTYTSWMVYTTTYGGSLPDQWGHFKLNAEASSNGWVFRNGTSDPNTINTAAGVQRNCSAWSGTVNGGGNMVCSTGPTAPSPGQQTMLIQGRGTAYTTLNLEPGQYMLRFKAAGRGNSGQLFDGNLTYAVAVRGTTQGGQSFTVASAQYQTTTGSAFIAQTLPFQITTSNGAGAYTLSFEGQAPIISGTIWDSTALFDQVELIPANEDIYSLKVFPIDRVEDRNGNYMHIDYGGSHDRGTVVDSYGTAQVVLTTLTTRTTAQGPRPAVEMYPRRFTYGMRTASPLNGHNLASVSGVEVARVILNYEDRLDASGTVDRLRMFDTGSGQMLLSKRLKTVYVTVGGTDDTSLITDRQNFHLNESQPGTNTGGQCLTGTEVTCGTLLRRYTLAYEVGSATGRSRLASITECSGDNQCLSPTTFTWSDENYAPGATNPLGGTTGSAQPNTPINWDGLGLNGRVADIIGDGRSRIVKRLSGNELAVCSINGPNTGGTDVNCQTWAVPVPANQSIPADGSAKTWHLADFTGDGIADLIVTDNNTGFTCATQVDSNSQLATGFAACTILPSTSYSPSPRLQQRKYAKVGDVDGDGRLDVIFYRGDGAFEVCRAPGYGGSAAWQCRTPTQVANLAYSSISAEQELDNTVFADFNGDGRTDLAIRVAPVCVNGSGDHYDPATGTTVPNGTSPATQCVTAADNSSPYWGICFASGSLDIDPGLPGEFGFTCSTHSGAGVGGAVAAVTGKVSRVAVYDFNGDGLADFAAKVTGGWRVCLSVGDGEFFRGVDASGNTITSGDCPVWTGPVGESDKTVAGDFNGDGRTDLATFLGGTSWQICLSTGSGFRCFTAVGPPQPADCGGSCFEAMIGDFNGDGKSDLVVNVHKAANGNIQGKMAFSFATAVMPDQLRTITTGLGATTTVNYASLAAATAPYVKMLNDRDVSPVKSNEIVIQSPMYVVASTLASTALSGQFYLSRYNYESLRADKYGRGLYGFYRRSVDDNLVADAQGVVTSANEALKHVSAIRYSQRWPNIGRPEVTAKSVAGKVISSVAYGYGRRCRNAANTIVACPSDDWTPGYRWEGLQLVSVQNPRWARLAKTDTLLTYRAYGWDQDLDASPLPTSVVYSGIEPSVALADTGTTDPMAGTLNLAGYYDDYGNPTRVVTRTWHPSSSETWQQTVNNVYYPAITNQWLLGKLDTATTTTEVANYPLPSQSSSVSRKAKFTYQSVNGAGCFNASLNVAAAPGQLCSEVVEPDYETAGDRTLFQRTAYEYDAFGNRTRSTVSFFEDQAGTTTAQRASGVAYLFGKYPTSNTRYYTGYPARDLQDTREYGDLRCRMPTKVTDANGNFATMEYDGFCRKVRETARTSDSRVAKQTTYTLSSAGLGAGEVYALTTLASDGAESIQYYDNLQRVVRAKTRRFDYTASNPSYAEARTAFDALGRQQCAARPVAGTASALAPVCNAPSWAPAVGSAVTTLEYDAANRPVKENLPDGNSTTTTYSGLTTTVSRTNANGTAGATASAALHVTSKTANAKGLVATVTTAPIATTVSNTYDPTGNLVKVASPGPDVSGVPTVIEKSMTYDIRGRQTGLVDPDAGSYVYRYNGIGEQVSQTDGNGATTTTAYDPFGRKRQRSETSVGRSASTDWVYGLDPQGCSNAKGLLCKVTYTVGVAVTSRETVYDVYSRPLQTRTAIDGQTFVSQVAYDARSRVKYSVYPQATAQATPLSVVNNYNAVGQVEEVRHATTGLSYWKVNARGLDGQLTQGTLGGVITVNQGYASDGLGRVQRVNVTNGSAQAMPGAGLGLLDQTFDFESIGNLKARTLRNDSGTRNESESFTYDALDRLLGSAAATGAGLTAVPDVGAYSYDAAGNITTKAGLVLAYNTNRGSSAAANNRLCGIAVANSTTCSGGSGAISYDGNGNITNYTRPNGVAGSDGATITISGYTPFNLPTTVSKSLNSNVVASAEFAYDASYQRVRQIRRNGPITSAIADDTLYVVPGGFELHRDGNGKVVSATATVSGPDGAVATVTSTFDTVTGFALPQNTGTNVSSAVSGSNTVTRLLMKDHLGNMVAEVTLAGSMDGVGQVATGSVSIIGSTWAIHGFGPWGNARNGVNVDQRGFTGHEHLVDLGLIHMNGRLYDPVLGRFLQADPIIQAPHNAQSHNRYSYVLNNPLSFSDPSGFSFWTKWRKPIIALAASIITAGAAAAWMSAYAIANGATVFATATGSLTGMGSMAAVAAGGFAAGGINGGNIQSALRGAFMAALTFGVVNGISDVFASVSGGDGGLCFVECGPGVQHLTAGGDSVAQAVNSTPNLPLQTQISVSDASTAAQVMERVEITDRAWYRDALEWLHRGPTDRNTIGGAVWMTMMAMPGMNRVGGLARGANTLSKAEQLAANQRAGAIGEKFLARTYGGEQQVSKTTSMGTRRLDNLVDGIAQESKVGRTALTTRIEAQIVKDVELMADRASGVTAVEWHFFPGTSGLGPTAPLANRLLNCGITVCLHP